MPEPMMPNPRNAICGLLIKLFAARLPGRVSNPTNPMIPFRQDGRKQFDVCDENLNDINRRQTVR
jgi:hypothetical protein